MIGGLTATSTVLAAETNFNYTSVSIAAIGVSLDDDLVIPVGGFSNQVAIYDSLSGAGVTGAIQLDSNIVIGLSSTYLSNSGFGTKIEESAFAIGAGYVIPTGPATDVFLSADFVRITAEVCNRSFCFKDTERGYGLSGGARHWVTQSVEINGSLNYVDVGDFGDSTSVGIGGAYWFNANASARLGLGFSSDATSASLGFGFAF